MVFDEPLHPDVVDDESVILLPYEQGEPCSVDLGCGDGGSCVEARCQRDPVDATMLADLRSPPLSQRRRARLVPLTVALDEGARALLITPRRPLAPRARHALLLGPALRDVAGNALGEEVRTLRFTTAAAASGRPTLELLSPHHEATELPTNLARLLVRASQPLSGATGEGLFWLEGDDGARIPLSASAADDLCPSEEGRPRCLRLRLVRPLGTLRVWTLRVSSRVANDRGAEVFPGELRFASGDSADHRPPGVLHASLRLADGCALLDLRTDEPTDLRYRGSWSSANTTSVGSGAHRAGVVLPGAVEGTLWAEIADLAGNRAVTHSFAVRLAAPPQVAITEVLANPLGPEPAQELIELHNRSPLPVALGGWWIDDGDDGVGVNSLPDVTLAPGQRAVVVGPRFDALASAAPIASGALLVRLDKTLGALGLANSGELVVLRDASGRLISSYGGFLGDAGKAPEGLSMVRTAGTCDLPESWRSAPPSPGSASEG